MWQGMQEVHKGAPKRGSFEACASPRVAEVLTGPRGRGLD